jgi:hypothetical protein
MERFSNEYICKLVGKTNCSGKTINGYKCGNYKEKQEELWYCDDHKKQSVHLYLLKGIMNRYVPPEIENICLEYYSMEIIKCIWSNTLCSCEIEYYGKIGDWITCEKKIYGRETMYSNDVIYLMIENGYLEMVKYFMEKLELLPKEGLIKCAYDKGEKEIFEYLNEERMKQRYPKYKTKGN